MSLLATLRNAYRPTLSNELASLSISWKEGEVLPLQEGIEGHFPLLGARAVLHGVKRRAEQKEFLKVGVLFSGGPAAGGHNVIWGLHEALSQAAKSFKLIGFLNGPKGLVTDRSIEIGKDHVDRYRNSGGFDLLGTGRDKIETAEQYEGALKTAQKHALDGLVIIGGDDSNTNAAFLAEYFLTKSLPCRVVGVPKTIDGDLKNSYVEESFGFDTASKTYAEAIGNIAADAASQKKYHFFIKLMGRSASHLTLECALRTHPNLALIGEEIKEKEMNLDAVVEEITNLVIERTARGKSYSVILIPEGIAEFIPHFQEGLKLDPHGNIPVSQIESERFLIERVQKRLQEREFTEPFSAQPLFLGYEGRSAFPTNFDADYCYALGFVAALLIREGRSGYMAGVTPLVKEASLWSPIAVPLTQLMQMELRKGKEKPVIAKALVDLKGESFLRFQEERESWRLEDDYKQPGPIQFFGESALIDSRPMTLEPSDNRSISS